MIEMKKTLKKTLDEAIEILQEVADDMGGTVRTDYSGRFMYGAECIGIVCENDTECMELAAEKGLTGSKTDNMGKRYIVYYPSYITKEKEEIT